MTGPDADASLAAALDSLRRLGCEGEAYFESGRRARVAVSGGQVESVEERRERGMGLRAFRAGRVGFAFTSDLSPQAVSAAARRAAECANHAVPDDACGLAVAEPAAPLGFPNEDPAADRVTPARRIELALAVEAAARASDPRVRNVREASVVDYIGEVRIVHTEGLDASFRFSRAVAHAEVAATEGDLSQVGDHAEFALGPGGLDPEVVGREAAARALGKLGARPVRTGRVAAVLDREVVSGLLEALAPAFSGRRVLRRTSPLAGRLGRPVASPAVTLVDDPRLAGGAGSAPVDGEGVPTGRRVLVGEGVFRAYLHDSYSARKLGAGGPGNSLRGSYLSPPRIGPMNLLLLPGTSPVDTLVDRAGSGVLIREVMGLHTVDPVSGDFSLGGSGAAIVGGRAAGPVDRLAFSGNLMDLLSAVEAVGADMRLFPGGGGAPSVLLRELSIAGE